MDVKFPIGELNVPETVTLDDVQEWINEINTYTNRLRETVDSLTDEQLRQTYREGSWNVRELVHHLADSQLNMYQRLKLALTDDKPSVAPSDQDKCAEHAHTKLAVESSIKMLEGIHERIVSLGSIETEEQVDRGFTLQGRGFKKVSTKLAKHAWHE